MRVAYISLQTPYLRSSWSGIPWYSLQEIQRRFPDTHVIDTPRADRLVDKFAKLERFGVNVRRSPPVTSYYAWRINAALERIRPDVVIAISAAHKLAWIDRRWPIVYAADALYMSVMTYYEKYADTGRGMLLAGERVQRAFLERADRVLMASQWGADSARQHYGLLPDCVSVAPMGANLDSDPGFVPPSMDTPLTLLFVGYTWERKGGPLVLETWRELRARGVAARLHIVGVEPEEARGLEGVELHGRIDKSDPVQYAKIDGLYRQSHFFFMPGRQEAYGIVYCEAAAFGRPVVAAETGGIPTIVLDGETGLVLPMDAGPALFADRILALWQDRNRYAATCVAARNRFETVLNWRAWGARVEAAIGSMVPGYASCSRVGEDRDGQ